MSRAKANKTDMEGLQLQQVLGQIPPSTYIGKITCNNCKTDNYLVVPQGTRMTGGLFSDNDYLTIQYEKMGLRFVCYYCKCELS